MMHSILKGVLSLGLLLFVINYANAQQANQSESLAKIDDKIKSLNTEKENLSQLMKEISSDQLVLDNALKDGSWNKYQQTKKDLENLITEWEQLRISIVNQNNQVVVGEKIKITRIEFDALPESNQKAILSEPNRFEIVEQ